MPQNTTNFDLVLFDEVDDKPETFVSYRVAIAGTQSTSNMNIIDEAMQENKNNINTIKGVGWVDETIRGNALAISNLKTKDIYTVQVSGTNALTGTITDISSVPNDAIIKVIPNTKNTGTVTVSINGETVLPLVKVRNISGSTVYTALDAGDLQANMPIFITKSPTGIRYIAVGFGEDYARNLFYDNGDGTFTSVQEKLDEITTPLKSATITQTGTAQLGGSVYKDQEFQGQSDFLQLEGMTLVNNVINGDFSDGVTGWTNGVSVSNNILTVNSYRTFQGLANAKGTDIYFLYSKVRWTQGTQPLNLTIGFTGLLQQTHVNPVQDVWYENYWKTDATDISSGVVQLAFAGTVTEMEVDGNAGVFAINMTALGIEDYTEEQMLELIRNGYFEGFGHADGTVTITEKNLFDKSKVEYGGYYDRNTGNWVSNADFASTGLTIVKELITHIASPIIAFGTQTSYWDAQGNFISGEATSSLLNVPADAHYVRMSIDLDDLEVANLTLDDIQIEIGTTITDCEPYHAYTIESENLKRSPNDVSDIKHVSTGKIWRTVAPVDKDYETLQPSEITALVTTNTNFDLVRIEKPLDSKLYNDTTISETIKQFSGAGYGHITTVTGFDSPENVDKLVNSTATLYAITFAKGKYTSLADAQTKLSVGGVDEFRYNYQLGIPIIEQGEASQPNLTTGGMMYTDSVVAPTVISTVNLNLASTVKNMSISVAENSNELLRKVDKDYEVFNPTLINSWLDYSGSTEVAYYKNDLNIVSLEGSAYNGVVASGTTIFILPVGYRPIKDSYFVVYNGATNDVSKILINTSGEVKISDSTTLSSILSFDGIAFRV